MSRTLTSATTIASAWSYVNTDDLDQDTKNSNASTYRIDMTTGVGSEEVNFLYTDRRIVTAASANDDLDFSGSLRDVFGNTILATQIKELTIRHLGTTSGPDIIVGAAGTNPITSLFDGSATAVVKIKAGGALCLIAPLNGFAVVAGSADTLRIAYDGASGNAEYDIIVKGIM